jgi:hypothetical protein
VNVLWTALYLTVPLIVAGIIHMAVVRANLLSVLARPISEPMFGPNKTWRGVVVMTLGAIAGIYVAVRIDPLAGNALLVRYSQASPVVVGAALGVAYCIAELPNSFMKRRLGVAPGMLPDRNRLLFATLDQADSAFGCAIALFFLIPTPISVLVVVVILGPAVHLVVNFTLWAIGLRKRPI